MTKTINPFSGASVGTPVAVKTVGSLNLHAGIPERGANDTGNWKQARTPATTYVDRGIGQHQRGANDRGPSKSLVVGTKVPNG